MRTGLSRRQWAADLVLAGGFTVVGQLYLDATTDDGYLPGGVVPVSVVLTALTTLSLGMRRVAPVRTAAWVFGVNVVAAVVVPHSITMWGSLVPLAVLLYSASRHGPVSSGPWLLVLPAAFVATAWIHVPTLRQPDDFLITGLVLLAAWGTGQVINRLVVQRTALDTALAELDARHGERRRQVLLAERTRIAQEMHDVVAHGVSIIVVQAGAARVELPDDADTSRQRLLAVERTGREVLAELRRTVGLLRAVDEPASDARPAPGIHDLPELVATMEAAGLDVSLDLSLPEPDAGRGLVVYRLVQEALTNVLRHAGPTRVSVRVSGEDDVVVEVVDDGPSRGSARAPAGVGGGHGHVGMRERVAIYGGSMTAGPTGSGYAVRARIPAGEVAT